MRESTEFLFRSVSGTEIFVDDIRGSVAANAAEASAISTLNIVQTGAWS